GRSEGRILVPDRADDDERMNLNPVGMRFVDQVLKRVEVLRDRRKVRRRLERVEIPRVAAPPHLRKDRVRMGGLGVVHDGDHVGVVVKRSVEGVYPKSLVLTDGLRRRDSRNRRQPDEEPDGKTGRPKWLAAICATVTCSFLHGFSYQGVMRLF